MSAAELPAPGSLIEVEHAGARVLAIVLAAARGKLDVVTESGEAVALSAARVADDPGFRQAVPDARAGAEIAAKLRRQVDAALAELDLATIWELVSTESSDPMTARDLAALWFGDVTPVAYFAIASALRVDTVYFKKRADRFGARTPKEVESVRQQQRGESRKGAVRQRFLAGIAEALAGDAAAVGALRAEPDTRALLDLVWDYAAHGETFERRADAEAVLTEIGQAQPSGFAPRSTPAGAFELLRRLGLVSENENLALRRYRIRTEFEPSLLELAHRLAAVPPVEVPSAVDLTDRPIVTIDGASTRDFDDALHAMPLAGGGWEIGIHVTDAASLVAPGSPLDLEARRRGSSVYLPTGVIPMLPGQLSEGRLSLIQGELRPAFSLLLELGPDGQRASSRLVLSLIRVASRLTYDEADRILEAPESPHHAGLRALEELAAGRAADRRQRGSIDVGLPEIDVHVEAGEVVVRHLERSRSRILVSELMVYAGERVAAHCLGAGIPTVFRTQEHAVDDGERERLAQVPEGLARQIELVKLMKRGELKSQPSPHRGLGLDAYVQCTSPMRRYADLVVDYQLRQHLLGLPLAFDRDEMVALAAAAESAASDAGAAQRDSDRYWLLEYLRRNQPERLEAVVLYWDTKSNRPTAPVVLTETMLRSNVAARGLSPGDRIEVRLVKADPRRDMLKVEVT